MTCRDVSVLEQRSKTLDDLILLLQTIKTLIAYCLLVICYIQRDEFCAVECTSAEAAKVPSSGRGCLVLVARVICSTRST